MRPTQNIHIRETVPLISPRDLKQEMPETTVANQTVVDSRDAVQAILKGEDDRMIAVVGPCSIHDGDAAMVYAARLRELADQVKDRLFVVMRVYFEKPRTTVGWKGLINDPFLNGTFDISAGLKMARTILLNVAELGLPAATEMLEPITPQYIADLVTLASIGARTTESQTHRQMASGLSMPVGYKNATDGDLQPAFDAMIAAQNPHSFLGIDEEGDTCIIKTTGNPYGHLIVRGGSSGPNYSKEALGEAHERLNTAGLNTSVLVDCSHGNSNKDYQKQGVAWDDVIQQRLDGNDAVIGLMLESNIVPGNQKLTEDLSKLAYGQSITDACVGWEETETLLRGAFDKLGG
jgi:3-deoxy-7-phosphoheptulonate synthase